MDTGFCLSSNLSREDVTEEAWSLNATERGSNSVYAISSILFICTVAGSLLNIFVLAALVYNKFWRVPSTFLLFNLALVDLLTCAFILPFMTVAGFAGGVFIFGSSDYERCHSCQAGVVIVIWMLYTSMHIIAIMSLDRLIYIKRPLQYDKWITIPRMAVILLVIWIFCLLLCIPPLFGFGVIGFSRVVGTCAPLFTTRSHLGPGYYYIGFLVLEVMIPLGVLVISNIWLLCFVRKGIKSRFENTYQEKGDARISEVNKQAKKKYIAQQLRMVKVFGSIFVSNFVTWSPIVFVFIAMAAIGLSNVPPAALGIVFFCFLIQAVIHPMLESLLSARVRKIAKKIFCVRCMKKSIENITQRSTLCNSGVHNSDNLEMSTKIK